MHKFNTIVYLDFVLSLFWAAENRIIVQDSLSADFFWKLELFKTRDTFMLAFFIYSQSDEKKWPFELTVDSKKVSQLW